VTEATRAAVSAVHPQTGALTTIAQGLGFVPNGLAFSPDYQTLYIASASSAAIYATHRNGNGQFGPVALFASTQGGVVVEPCQGLAEHAPCVSDGSAGTCEVSGAGGLMCALLGGCSGKAEGDTCASGTVVGVCTADIFGGLSCNVPAAPEACDTSIAGDSCLSGGRLGVCEDDGSGTGGLYCRTLEPCEGQAIGDLCTEVWGVVGVCEPDVLPDLKCNEDAPCQTKAVGDPCGDPAGLHGLCIDSMAIGILECDPMAVDACAGANVGDLCTDSSGTAGSCQDDGSGALTCVASSGACEAANVGDPCTNSQGQSGSCVSDGAGGLWCQTAGGDEALHALTTDRCGNVYVGGMSSGTVIRIAPDGSALELVAATARAPVTGLAFGSGVGGWDTQTLYVGVEGNAGILAVALGFDGRPMVMPEHTDTVPAVGTQAPSNTCMNLGNSPRAISELDKPRGYHDVAFDSDGYMIGSDESNLVRVNSAGEVQFYAGGLTTVQGMDWLPDGRLVLASDQGIISIAPSGGQTVLEPDITNGYGVTVGPDGLVYVGDMNFEGSGRVYRIDPAIPKTDVYLDPADFGQDWDARIVNFDADYSVMYIGSKGTSVYVVTLDAELNPVGAPRHFAMIDNIAEWLDGLGVDTCGNLYVPNYDTSVLFRVTPDGLVTNFWTGEYISYVHGLEWGNGVGGWKKDSIYLPQPYDNTTVIEFQIGVGSAHPH